MSNAKGLLAVVLLLTAGLLAGCGSGDASPWTTSMWVTTVDGRQIPCVWAADYSKAGLSCDWSAK